MLRRKGTKNSNAWLSRPAALSSFHGSSRTTTTINDAITATQNPAVRRHYGHHHDNPDFLSLVTSLQLLLLQQQQRRRRRWRPSRPWGCFLTLSLTSLMILSTMFHWVSGTTTITTPTNHASPDVYHHQHGDHDHDEARLIIENCLSSIGASMAEYHHHRHHHHHQPPLPPSNVTTTADDGKSNSHQYRSRRPFVTLAYAQSLDGKIALHKKETTAQSTPTISSSSSPSPSLPSTAPTVSSSSSSNFALSGPSSRCLTHALRSIHDAVLVGGRTLAVDNPRLDNRLWGTSSKATPTSSFHPSRTASVEQQLPRPQPQPQPSLLKQPRPVVLDPNLKYMKELKESLCIVQRHDLIVCHCDDVANVVDEEFLDDEEFKNDFWDSVTFLPCKTISCQNIDDESDNDGVSHRRRHHHHHHHHLDLEDVLYQLYRHCGIRSVMVEGGAAVLSSFARADLVDCICVTIAPMILGNQGLDAFVDLSRTVSQQMGNKDEISRNDKSNCNNNHERVHLGPLRCFSLGSDCIVLSDWKHKSKT